MPLSALTTELTARVTELSRCKGYNFLTVDLPTGQWFQLLHDRPSAWEFNIGAPNDSPVRGAVLEWCKSQGLSIDQVEETSLVAAKNASVPQAVDMCLSLLGLLGVRDDAAAHLKYDLHCDSRRYVAAPSHPSSTQPSRASRGWQVPAGLGGILGAALARALLPSLPAWIAVPTMILGGLAIGGFVFLFLWALWRAGWIAWTYLVLAVLATWLVPFQFKILVGGVLSVVGLGVLVWAHGRRSGSRRAGRTPTVRPALAQQQSNAAPLSGPAAGTTYRTVARTAAGRELQITNAIPPCPSVVNILARSVVTTQDVWNHLGQCTICGARVEARMKAAHSLAVASITGCEWHERNLTAPEAMVRTHLSTCSQCAKATTTRVRCAAAIAIADYVGPCRWLEETLTKQTTDPGSCEAHIAACPVCTTRVQLMFDAA